MFSLLYAKKEYINKTYHLVLSGLEARYGDKIDFINVSQYTPEAILKRLSKSRLMIIDSSITYAKSTYAKNDLFTYFPDYQSKVFYAELLDQILNLNQPLVYFQGMDDLHRLDPLIDEGFFKKMYAIIWFFHREPPKRSQISTELLDPWMIKASCPNQIWHKINKLVQNKFELMHCLDENDFILNAKKKWDISVCGERYQARRIMYNHFKKLSFKVAPYLRNDRFILAISKMIGFFLPHSADLHKQYVQLRRRNQNDMISRSTLSFTCGSGYCYPVRKFFEIPAASSLLLALPFNGMADCGFTEGKHYIPMDHFSDSKDRLKKLLTQDTLISNIQRNNIQMLRRLHMQSTRVKQLFAFLNDVASENQVISQFIEGEFVHAVN